MRVGSSVPYCLRPRRIWILQITVYYKELLTINCQGTNHPRSILSFMDISILYPPHSWPLLSPVPSAFLRPPRPTLRSSRSLRHSSYRYACDRSLRAPPFVPFPLRGRNEMRDRSHDINLVSLAS